MKLPLVVLLPVLGIALLPMTANTVTETLVAYIRFIPSASLGTSQHPTLVNVGFDDKNLVYTIDPNKDLPSRGKAGVVNIVGNGTNVDIVALPRRTESVRLLTVTCSYNKDTTRNCMRGVTNLNTLMQQNNQLYLGLSAKVNKDKLKQDNYSSGFDIIVIYN